MKNVLVVYYSQSGQLKDIAQNIALPFLNDDEIRLDFYAIEPQNDFPFPWDNASFFGVFPETFRQIPQEIKTPPQNILTTDYDLILFHYQVWFLSPSLPVTSFLKSSYAGEILKNKPVVTINGSRNMWALAQEKVKKLLAENQAHLVGNIALTDRNINLVSVVTIVDWLFSGIKRKAYGIFPLPGVSDKEIEESSKFSEIIKKHLKSNDYNEMQPTLIANGAVEFRWFLISMDKKANKMFKAWSTLILKFPGQRVFLLKCFKVYLFIAIWILSPIVHLIELILYPLRYFSIQKQKKYHQGI